MYLESCEKNGKIVFCFNNCACYSGEIFFLVYSITDRESFKEITRLAFLVKFIHKMSKVKPRLILLGSKLDLYQHRQVDHAEGATAVGISRTEDSAGMGMSLQSSYIEPTQEIMTHRIWSAT